MANNINEWEMISEAEALGTDDWEPITEEEALNLPQERGRIAEVGAALGRGFLDLAHLTGRAYQKLEPTGRLSEAYFQTIGAESPVAKSLERIELTQAEIPRTRKGLEGWALNIVGQGAPYLAATVASGGAAGLGLPFGIGFGSGFDKFYGSAKEAGTSENRAMVEGALGGLVEGGLEMWGVSNLIKFKAAGKGSLKALVGDIKGKLWKAAAGDLRNITGNMLKSAVVEGLEEASQEIGGLIIPAVSRREYPTKPDGTPDWWRMISQVGEATAGGGLLGALVPAGMNVPTGISEIAAPTRTQIEGAAKAIQESKLSDYAKARSLQELEKMLPVGEQISATEIEKPAEAVEVKEPTTKHQKTMNYIEKKRLVADERNLPIDALIAREISDVRYFPEAKEFAEEYKSRIPQWDGHEFPNLGIVATIRLAHETESLKRTEKPAQVKEPTVPGIVQQERDKGLFEIPEPIKRQLEIAKKFETVLIDLEAKRPELKASTREETGNKLQTMKEMFEQLGDDPIIAGRIARSFAKDFARERIPELTEQISRDEIVELYQAVREGNLPRGDLASMMTFFEAIKAGVQPFKSHIKIFDKFFGTNIIKRAKRVAPTTKRGRIYRTAIDLLNVPRAIMCSCDHSAGMIQAAMVLPNNPIIWSKGMGKGFRAAFSPEYTDLVDMEMRTNSNFGLIERFGPNLITEVGNQTAGEEAFISELAHKIPAVGRLVRASDRMWVTALNSMRSNLFYQYMELNPTASNQEITEILDHIGNLTGRGRGKAGGKFEKFAPELAAVFWTPRLFLGTFKTFTDPITKPHIRKIAAGDLIQATGFLLGILGLASLIPGWEVEFDPRSTDFGKIKIGNTRIAFFGRHTQMIRVTAQILLAKKKATSTGRIHSRKRLKIAAHYLRSKLSPPAGVAVDITTGKTFLGQRTEWGEPAFTTKYIYEHIAPMFLQDVVDAARYQGIGTALWTSPLGVHGVGMQTYEIHAGGESMRLKDHYAHQYFGADWDELGPAAQKALRESQPLIELYEDRAKIEQSKYAYENWADEEQREAGRKVQKSLSKEIQSELNRLELPFKGFSRRLSSNWFLNEKRYGQYQNESQKLINQVVPTIIGSPAWKELSADIQRNMLDQLIDECKKAVRQKIINQAKFEDLERIVL